MKEIPNQQFTAEETTVSLLKMSLNFIPKTGFDLAAIRSRNRVMDAIEQVAAGGIIKLEDGDFTTAQNCIREVRWVTLNKHQVTFAEQFGL